MSPVHTFSSKTSVRANHQLIFGLTVNDLLVPTFLFVTTTGAAAEAQLASLSPSPIIYFNSFRDKRKWQSAPEPHTCFKN